MTVSCELHGWRAAERRRFLLSLNSLHNEELDSGDFINVKVTPIVQKCAHLCDLDLFPLIQNEGAFVQSRVRTISRENAWKCIRNLDDSSQKRPGICRHHPETFVLLCFDCHASISRFAGSIAARRLISYPSSNLK